MVVHASLSLSGDHTTVDRTWIRLLGAVVSKATWPVGPSYKAGGDRALTSMEYSLESIDLSDNRPITLTRNRQAAGILSLERDWADTELHRDLAKKKSLVVSRPPNSGRAVTLGHRVLAKFDAQNAILASDCSGDVR